MEKPRELKFEVRLELEPEESQRVSLNEIVEALDVTIESFMAYEYVVGYKLDNLRLGLK